jgi:2'-hydroxyisoflavone reductase
MDLLVLGGTAFLGRAVVADALARGHRVTTYNRGRTAPDADGVEALHGDRTVPDQFAVLAGRRFDAVLDTSGYVPRDVAANAALLAPTVPRYAFVSSVSVYRDWPAEPCPENAPLHDGGPDDGPEAGDYGQQKVGCERAVQRAYDGSALIVRPGLIVGPWEDVGRLPAWLRRGAAGGRMLAPGDPALRLQLIDARDLAAWMLDGLERGLSGTYNATGPEGQVAFADLVAACAEVTGAEPTGAEVTGAEVDPVWVDDAFLVEHGVAPWTELPFWLPQGPDTAWRFRVDTGAAEREGLRCRPVRDTVADTWAWLREVGSPPQRADRPRHGLDPAKEQQLLAAWDARPSA